MMPDQCIVYSRIWNHNLQPQSPVTSACFFLPPASCFCPPQVTLLWMAEAAGGQKTTEADVTSDCVYSALSSSIHAGTVSATGLPAIRIWTPALHYLTIDLQCLWPMTRGCNIGISRQGWQRGHRWQVRRGARRLLSGRRGPSRRGFLGQRRCIGAERLDKRVKPGLQCRQDWGD